MGVHSQSMERPLKTANFPQGYESFTGAGVYSAWRFVPQTGGGPAAREKPTAPAAPAAKFGPSTTATAGESTAPAAVRAGPAKPSSP